ncbi:MAG TPA: DUF6036 family nucleotidyltransferase [Myxococcaceae bacterium]|jgi:hypothetical protein
MLPTIVIPAFDAFLAARGLRLEAIVIGGTALNLLGVVRRETRDCDVLAPTREELAEALPWVEEQDANEQWPQYVRQMFEELGRRLRHGV